MCDDYDDEDDKDNNKDDHFKRPTHQTQPQNKLPWQGQQQKIYIIRVFFWF